MKTFSPSLAVLAVFSLGTVAHGHDGRRLEILVFDNQLFTQGYISGSSPVDDGGGLVRPYYNALHNHWSNVGPVAIADLPGFDLMEPAGLLGYDLTLALTGAGQWHDPLGGSHGGGHGSGHGGMPTLTPLGPGEQISIGFGTQPSIGTDTPGSFKILDNVAGPTADIDLQYSILLNPENTLYYLQWQLSTDAPGIAASEPIYMIFAPDPSATSGLHHAALALERHFGIAAVPEPGTTGLLAVAAGWGLIARRRRR